MAVASAASAATVLVIRIAAASGWASDAFFAALFGFDYVSYGTADDEDDGDNGDNIIQHSDLLWLTPSRSLWHRSVRILF